MRTFVIVSLVLVVVFLLYLNTRNNYTDQIQQLHTTNDSLREMITARDYELTQKEDYIKEKQDSLKKVQDQLIIKEAELRQLEANYSDLKVDMPPDEVYDTLQRVYPTEQELKYPFSESQVQNIYLTYLQKKQRGLIISNLQYQMGDYQRQVGLLKDMTKKQEESIFVMKETRADLEKIIVNKDVVIDYHRSEFLRERRKKRLWMVVAGAALGAAIYF